MPKKHLSDKLKANLRSVSIDTSSWNPLPSHALLTLPYHTGKTFYRLALRPLMGPMRIPELTVRLQNPQVQYSPGFNTWNHPLPSEGLLTWTYLLTCTLGISKRISARST